MPIEYYIGIAVGVISVLLAYVISNLRTRRGAKCDKCKEMRFKDWKGRTWCRKKGWFYFNPRYCALYEEEEDEHGST